MCKRSLHIHFSAMDFHVAEYNALRVINILSNFYDKFKGPIPLKKEIKDFKTQSSNNSHCYQTQEFQNVTVYSVKIVLYGLTDDFSEALDNFTFSQGVSIELKQLSI